MPKQKNKLKGYPHYPDNEDIYNREKEEKDIDPENPEKFKTPNEKPAKLNEKNFTDDVSGGDLDIPVPDNAENDPANEDEENSYYSLGGDEHNELEENRED
ncbi:MAG TPA: hypothetical protein VNZ49_00485 [Bacteroidia bacterium]|jgi:hypothetical protein|nr:hypothetical protein [Bacteroidia bacterium]